jgi:hypothetical protein
LQQAEIDMLEVERAWLTKQGPLRDTQLGLAQTRYAVRQQESADAILVIQPASNGYETVAAHTEPLARDVP